ncbi:MAG: TMEM175 family protein [Candidatus Eremiobacteraeota bacterium]|nr:TMEM175 family protein [Candidatus Eremiobacteraeota bacterium]
MIVLTEGRDERLLHRLEAFSDVVIGFSLAQLGLSLVIPARIAMLWHRPTPFIGFLITFQLICVFWYMHNRLFAHYFVPTRLNLILNFFALGSVILLVYSVQLYIHFPHERTAVAFYAASLSLAFGFIAILFSIGLRERRVFLDAKELLWGRKRVARLGCISAALVIFVLVASFLSDPASEVVLTAFVAAGAVVSRIIVSRMKA